MSSWWVSEFMVESIEAPDYGDVRMINIRISVDGISADVVEQGAQCLFDMMVKPYRRAIRRKIQVVSDNWFDNQKTKHRASFRAVIWPDELGGEEETLTYPSGKVIGFGAA